MKLFYKTKGRTYRQAGFTLIELMVVIAIIGLLASIITVSLSSAQAKGRDAKRVADIRTIQLALEEYYNDNGNYPPAIYSGNYISPTYIAAVPTDPKDNSQYFYSAYNSVPNTNCLSSNKPVKYHLAAAMESTAATNSALNQDVDFAYSPANSATCNGSYADFNGNAPSCASGVAAVSPASADNCYDVTN
jgi:prepilin-type N-terminal cleavage/methylation domain-containing protein